MSTDFEQRYKENDIPWDTGRADYNLTTCVADFSIQPSSAVVVGCGTGSNVFWLAEQGFTVRGLDLSETALAIASQKAQKNGVDCQFSQYDILTTMVPGGNYSFAFDRGCFHCFDNRDDRDLFAKRVYDALESGGYWLSLIGNADAPKREIGPPVLSASEVLQAVEPYFEIISLETSYFDSEQENPPRIWRCLMQRRSEPIL